MKIRLDFLRLDGIVAQIYSLSKTHIYSVRDSTVLINSWAKFRALFLAYDSGGE